MRNANLIVKAGMLATCLPFIGCNSANKSEKSQEERPNILFILSDDHTGQAWGIYGGILADYVKNENIRRLAAEGCVLDNCFCTNSISAPSRHYDRGIQPPQRRLYAGGRVGPSSR